MNSEIFLRLSQHRGFWRLRAFVERQRFRLLSRVFRVRYFAREERANTGILFSFLTLTAWQLLLAIGVAGAFQLIELALVPQLVDRWRELMQDQQGSPRSRQQPSLDGEHDSGTSDPASGILHSLWFEQKYEHKQWYMTEDSTTTMAHRTGVFLGPSAVPEYNWLEAKLEKIPLRCFAINAARKRLDNVRDLLTTIDAYVTALAANGNVRASTSLVRKVREL